MLLDVVKVKVCPDYQLELEFENEERRRFDMSAYMDKKPFNLNSTVNPFQKPGKAETSREA